MKNKIKRDLLLALAIGAGIALSLVVGVAVLAGGMSHVNCTHL